MVSKEVLSFLKFVDTAKCFDAKAKINLAVFLCGLKKACFVRLKVNPKNIDDPKHFEEHIAKCKFLFKRTEPKSFEEIESVTSVIKWGFSGIWFGYDLFSSLPALHEFEKYHVLLKKKHESADLVAGKLYGYPSCCVKNFILEHSINYLKNFSYADYYKRLHDGDRDFPWVSYLPCPKCKASKLLNQKYEACVKKFLPRTYHYYKDLYSLNADFIVDAESDVLEDGRSIWPEKDAHEYSLISTKPVDNHYYIISFLSKKQYPRGMVFSGKADLKYDYADVKVNKVLGVKKIVHVRQLSI